jgi:hypothetical protein
MKDNDLTCTYIRKAPSEAVVEGQVMTFDAVGCERKFVDV